ncbi:MAG: hypoxanthine phosphoribosyltransferase [Chloroflexi bacterium]|nr:hypoxanthine phosphoribosyltransferase [Chloroflexota bacterium]
MVRRLALEVGRDYRGRRPVLVGVLKGAFVFLADLVRELDLDFEVDFVRLASYGSGTTSSGRVRVTAGLKTDVAGRDLLVVEDIIDTGYTTERLLRYLRARRPGSMKVCALLSKPARRKVKVPIDYLGAEVPDRFLVGYGLDYAQRHRGLPDIYALEEGRDGA